MDTQNTLFMPSKLVQKWLNDWDVSIKNWAHNGKALNGLLSPFAGLVSSSKLSADYLPEPYYGNPDNCSAVVLNINPGSSSPNEWEKLWAHNACPKCRLIYDFVNSFSSTYSAYQNKYSPFIAQNWVPGVQWWNNNRNGFINRIVSLYNDHHKGTSKNTGNTPFAIELCPLHSNDVTGINFGQKALQCAYRSNVIEPAADVIRASDIPFGLGFASSICNILQKPACGGFYVVKTWKDGIEVSPSSSQKTIPGWPKDKKGVLKKRTYKLLCSDAFKDCIGSRVYFLFTWDQSGSIIKITTKMMNDYASVDEYIVKEIASVI